ncbi:MAG: DUF3991 and TOPRIM domain-containing protein [Oscillospiraceae bacterium]|nr:DUF3991 and TOPRIM domain-containing protein [Oscillospiraceae bacterium]
MAQYIPFTEEQKLRAGAVDLEEFLRQRGETLIRSGRDKRMESDHSVTVRGNEWYDHSARRGGGPIAFVQRFYNMSYPEAVTLLLGGENGTAYPAAREKPEEPRKPFELPPENLNMRRVFAYLMKQRSIDKDVVSHFVRAELLYEDAEHHNCVFVGTDEHGVPRHAHLRSTNSFGSAFRINVEGSDPSYSFHHIGRTGCLLAFEAPIDMMSYITLRPHLWQEHSYVACCGTSIQPVQKMLERMPRVDTVFLCLDNDKAGCEASGRFAEALSEQGVETERLLSEKKDWNEDLVVQSQAQEVTRSCQAMCCP